MRPFSNHTRNSRTMNKDCKRQAVLRLFFLLPKNGAARHVVDDLRKEGWFCGEDCAFWVPLETNSLSKTASVSWLRYFELLSSTYQRILVRSKNGPSQRRDLVPPSHSPPPFLAPLAHQEVRARAQTLWQRRYAQINKSKCALQIRERYQIESVLQIARVRDRERRPKSSTERVRNTFCFFLET